TPARRPRSGRANRPCLAARHPAGDRRSVRLPPVSDRPVRVEPAGPDTRDPAADPAERRNPDDKMELHPGGCPSGQRERSVKPPAQPTEVRILPLPPTDHCWGVLRTEGPDISELL